MSKFYAIFIIFLLGLFSVTPAQNYYLKGYAGFGYSRFISDMELSGLNKNGLNGTLRFMWQPEHLLRLGVETGYHQLYTFSRDQIITEFGTTGAHSSLSALPVFIDVSMQVTTAVEIIAGIGPTFLFTSFESFGNKSESTQISSSYMIGGSYTYKLTNDIRLGGELRYYHIYKINDATLTLQVMFIYHLLEW